MKKATGKVLRFIRLYLGYKQEYVAYKLNISKSLLGHIENGRTEIGVERLYLLAMLYKVSPQHLLGLGVELYENKSEWGLDRAIKHIVKLQHHE